MFHRKRPPVVLFIIPLFIGLLGLYNVMERSQFASYRTVDVIRLVAFGACLGAALTASVAMFRRPRA